MNTRKRFLRLLAIALLAALVAPAASRAATNCPGESPPILSLQKFASYRQVPGPALQPVQGYAPETPGDSHYFFAHFLGASGLDVGDGVLRFPSGREGLIEHGYWGSDFFPNAAALDAFAPAGSYTTYLDINGQVLSAVLPLRNYWPQPAMVQNVADTQNVDPSRPLVLRLNAWTTTAPDRWTLIIILKLGITVTNGIPIPNLPIYSHPRCGDPILGAVDSVTIPAGVLAPDQSYDCFITRVASEVFAGKLGPYATSQAMVTQTRIHLRTGQAAPETPPTVVWSSAPQTATEGQPATFSVQVTGHPAPTIQWLKNGQVIAGVTGSIHRIPACSRADAGRYHVRVSNPAGTAATTPVTLTVVPAPVPPLITRQPVGTVARVGQRVVLSVAARATPPPQYQWRRNSAAVPAATNALLVLAPAVETHSGTYDVVVFNRNGSVTSQVASVIVAAPPVIRFMPGRIRLEPLSTLSYPPVTLSADVQGTGPLFFQWKKDGSPIPGATSRQWTIPNPTEADGGIYSLMVSNAYRMSARTKGTRLVLATLPVLRAPVIIKQPTAQISRAGKLTLTVIAAKRGRLTYQWNRTGPGGAGAIPIPGATNQVYTVPIMTAADAGWYVATVSRRYPFPDRTVVLTTTSAAVEVRRGVVRQDGGGE